ncbi:MAG: (d)CMP kinase [Gammaproteobacteria bacterium]|nr:(d)CMP kinase [Gammaproteobacteria bacterium]
MADAPAVPVIAIDGPSGSGKGTLAADLAKRLGWHYLDSGALYRIVAAVALTRGIDLDAATALAKMAAEVDVRFEQGEVYADGENLTDAIRREEISIASSQVAALPGVRNAIRTQQHNQRRPPGLVADGRDMGTVVFRDADCKIFLDASAEVRAERRHKQLKNKGLSVSFRALLASIEERDARDTGRAVSPLTPAEDAVVIDSTRMNIEEVLEHVLAIVVERGLM